MNCLCLRQRAGQRKGSYSANFVRSDQENRTDLQLCKPPSAVRCSQGSAVSWFSLSLSLIIHCRNTHWKYCVTKSWYVWNVLRSPSLPPAVSLPYYNEKLCNTRQSTEQQADKFWNTENNWHNLTLYMKLYQYFTLRSQYPGHVLCCLDKTVEFSVTNLPPTGSNTSQYYKHWT